MFCSKSHSQPLDISSLTEEQLNEELEKGYKDILEGRVKPAKDVFEELSNVLNKLNT